MFNALSSDTSLEFKARKGSTIQSGIASGPILGGNLTTLCHLVGTPFEPDFKGHILLIEDTGEPPYRIDRMLSQMKLAGCWNEIKGVALGSFKRCGGLREIFRIVEDVFRSDKIPILGGFEIGHAKNNLTIPFGVEATLDAEAKTIRFHGPATVI
jgi:muramoyltetrapeptide carboxypeptidase